MCQTLLWWEAVWFVHFVSKCCTTASILVAKFLYTLLIVSMPWISGTKLTFSGLFKHFAKLPSIRSYLAVLVAEYGTVISRVFKDVHFFSSRNLTCFGFYTKVYLGLLEGLPSSMYTSLCGFPHISLWSFYYVPYTGFDFSVPCFSSFLVLFWFNLKNSAEPEFLWGSEKNSLISSSLFLSFSKTCFFFFFTQEHLSG